MTFAKDFPDFAAIEKQVTDARVQRAAYVGNALGGVVAGLVRGVQKVADSLGDGFSAERDRRAIEADAFLKRSVPRY
jgi:hypothetical protein